MVSHILLPKKRIKPSVEERLLLYSMPEPNSGCWLWIGAGSYDSYCEVGFEGRTQKAHRVAFKVWCGPIPRGLYVCHKCDVPACINPVHLFLGTAKQNQADSRNKGRSARGRRNGMVQYDEDLIRAVFHAEGRNFEIARRFGISDVHVAQIKTRKRWAHLDMTLH